MVDDKKIDYKDSGVDVQAGDDLVTWLQEDLPQKSLEKSPDPSNFQQKTKALSQKVISGIGGFAALFDGRFPEMEKPLLISCTDGVGTKVKCASYFQDYSTVGQDLVGMCVNDLLCTGGTPLFFLDYYAVGKLSLEDAKSFLNGVKKACEKSHLVLIGGETAEMPGVYQEKDFDCAGFSVGVVDQDKMWGAHQVISGDVVLGLASSGYHSNGYSLIRKLFENEFEKYRSWLMEPTRLYVEALFSVRNDHEIHAAAHITGGGIENLPRVLPEHLKAKIEKWEMPPCFLELQKRSGLSDQQMRETFNCGIGMMLILPKSESSVVQSKIEALGIETLVLGYVEERKPKEPHVVWI